jgi:subtilase family serine protease
VIEFSGSASQVQEAFHTSVHKYLVNGDEHWANAADPQIPTALAPAVAGIASLHDFQKEPLIRALGGFWRSQATGQLKSLTPLFTFPSPCAAAGFQTSQACYGVSPYDFATIYNVLPLWNAGIDGSGQSIAIAAASNIDLGDVRNFRSVFGLPPRDPVVIVNGRDPGVLNRPQPFEKEAISDVEWAGGVAPGATIQLVVSASTNSTSGFDLSVEYAVDNNLAPVLSASYSYCESSLGKAGNQFYSSLWQQAAAQGITVIIGTGDGGSAECDYESGASPPAPARSGLAVNGVSSTPYNVAVGGTDFADLTSAATYWSSTNGSTTRASAKGYIPETTWNDSCTNALFGAIAGYSADAEANCNNASLSKFVQTAGGTGGKSTTYTKPAWQAGPGVPADGMRDLPDISLFAGSAVSGSFYLFCEGDLQNGVPCNLDGPNRLIQGAAGTSISAPAFAGIMAMVVQNTRSRQGNPNPVFYKLAAQQTVAACNASGFPSTACIFHDVTAGTIAMPCARGSPNCVVTNPRDQYGILSGFDAGSGYDLATGLGSVDAFNLVTAAGWETGNVSIPAIDAGGVWNAASYAPSAPVAAGGIATVFGSFPVGTSISASELPLPLMLAGLSLKFGNGFPVPLLFVSDVQVNIQVPWELTGQTEALITAGIGGLASTGQKVSLVPFAPGIFAINGQGYGQGAILDSAYRLARSSTSNRQAVVRRVS